MLKRATWPLFTLSKKRKKIDTNPDYQRDFVYTRKQSSRLIESILIGIPIPTVYLCQENDGAIQRAIVAGYIHPSGLCHGAPDAVHDKKTVQFL